MVAVGARPLALEDPDIKTFLVVFRRGVSVLLRARQWRVAGDDHGVVFTFTLDAQRQGCDVDQEQLRAVGQPYTCQDGALHSSPIGDRLIGIDGLAEGLASKEVLQILLNDRHPCASTNEHDFVDVGGLQLGVLEHSLHGVQSAVEERSAKLFEVSPRYRQSSFLTANNLAQLDLADIVGRETPLRILCSTLGLCAHLFVHIVALLLHLNKHPISQAQVEILATQPSVATSSLNLNNTTLDMQNGHIKGATTQIEHQNIGRLLIPLTHVKTISQSSCCRLIYDPQNLETSDRSCSLRRFALGIIEICRNRDNCLLHLAAEVFLGNLLHLAEHHRADFFGGKFAWWLAFGGWHLNLEVAIVVLDDCVRKALHLRLHCRLMSLAANNTLHIEQRALRIAGSLGLGPMADQSLPVLAPSDVRRRGLVTALVRQDAHATCLDIPHCHSGISCPEVDTNDRLAVLQSRRLLLCGFLLLLLLRLLLKLRKDILATFDHALVRRIQLQACIEGRNCLLELPVPPQSSA
mmetsp:Transcript_84546/g.229471  ORF Transcript_84546/g.229471 Transcript_84546/m.229471 type:complete len:521 (-) Transcript_84546:407-1969(-)